MRKYVLSVVSSLALFTSAVLTSALFTPAVLTSALFTPAVLTSALFTSALAQTGAPGGGPSDPAVRARIQAMQPVFDLVGRVSLLKEMDAQKALALTKAQAKSLLPILKDLQSRADLKAKDATVILAKIEDKILTAKQVTWLDDTQLKREEQRRQRFQNASVPAGSGGQAGTVTDGTPRAGGERGRMFQAIQAGKPFNPFKDQRMGQPLTDLIALLAKR